MCEQCVYINVLYSFMSYSLCHFASMQLCMHRKHNIRYRKFAQIMRTIYIYLPTHLLYVRVARWIYVHECMRYAAQVG